MKNIFNQINFKYCKVLSLSLSIFLIFSCSDNTNNTPDTSDIKVSLNSKRLDLDLKSISNNGNLDSIALGLTKLKNQYPNFLDFYLDTIMGFQINGNYNPNNRGIVEGLTSFLTYKDYVGLFDTVKKHYPDTKSLESDLVKGFQSLKYYYPNYKTPHIIYFISGLMNWGVVSVDTIIGIGLDMYLGDKYPFYAAVGQPEYMYINFRPESIAPSVFATIYNDFHPFKDDDITLLEMMIQKGKQQYFVEQVLPFVNKEDCIGYTKPQLKWCENNEALIYNFFLNQNLMYEKNWQKMRRYVVYGPTSAGMPAESPGNIGTWLGLQIVKSYMKNHPKTPIEEMFSKDNGQQFLKESKYKPR